MTEVSPNIEVAMSVVFVALALWMVSDDQYMAAGQMLCIATVYICTARILKGIRG